MWCLEHWVRAHIPRANYILTHLTVDWGDRVTAILIVEDDELLCQAMVSLFERNGYSVYSALSGNQAIAIMKDKPSIDVVLSDYFMPDGDGRVLLEYVQTIEGTRPLFILITGQADLSAKQMIALGADQVLFKPIPTRELVRIVATALQASTRVPR